MRERARVKTLSKLSSFITNHILLATLAALEIKSLLKTSQINHNHEVIVGAGFLRTKNIQYSYGPVHTEL